jgi:hypothetical protein
MAGMGTALVLAACNGGSGPLVTTSSSTGRDDPGSTYDTPPSTSDEQGGDCLACDVVYDCPGAGPIGDGITLSSSEGDCTPALIDVVCSGALFGTGACSSGGGGPFTCGDITCTPEETQPGTSNSGGSGFSGGSSASSSGGNGTVDAG